MFFCLFFQSDFCLSDEHFFNQIKHTCFCFIILNAERERQTDSESSQHGTHTHARTSAAEALFCDSYLLFYNNAQRERKRENERLVYELKENV